MPSSETTLRAQDGRLSHEPPVPALTILFHPQLPRVGQLAILRDDAAGLSREGPEFSHPGGGGGAPLGDRFLSRRPLRLLRTRDGGITLSGEADSGAECEGRPLSGSVELSAADLRRGVVLELAHRVVLLLHQVAPDRPSRPPDLGLVGANEGLDELRRNILRVADLSVPVLIRGETGTGKDLVARAVHAASPRAGRPFVGINMAAIPPGAAASALFGHTRGAFTGAVADHDGYFRQAHGGSLFLDEIGAVPREIQPLLLRALESQEIQPVGSATTRRVDVRLIAATDADLERAIADESFRAALLHRLEGYQLLLPALRERRDDIGRLLVHFLVEELTATGERQRLDAPPDGAPTWLPAPFVARLARAPWPGNVRQLKNLVRQFTISSRGAPSLVVDAAVARLLDAACDPPPPAEAPPAAAPGLPDDAAILAALRACDWLPNRAAVRLGVSRSYLYARMKAMPGITRPEDLPRDRILACRDACQGDLDETARRLEVSRRGLLLRMKELGLR